MSDYNFKFNPRSGACILEVKHLLETTKVCGSNSTGTCFLQTFFSMVFWVIPCQSLIEIQNFETRFFNVNKPDFLIEKI